MSDGSILEQYLEYVIEIQRYDSNISNAEALKMAIELYKNEQISIISEELSESNYFYKFIRIELEKINDSIQDLN